ARLSYPANLPASVPPTEHARRGRRPPHGCRSRVAQSPAPRPGWGVYAMARKRVSTRGYASWLEREGLPVYTGYSIDDVNKLRLAPSARLGGSGAYVKLDGTDELTGLYVHEIPPGLTLEPERHLYEEVIYVLSGQGRAEYWREDTGRIHLDWQT